MRSMSRKPVRRRAAVAPLVAILMIPIFAMVAFAVDLGWIVLAKSDLQKAADAAALAGAQQLVGQEIINSNSGNYVLTNGFAQYYQPGQTQQAAIVAAGTAAAIQAAQTYAGYNSAGGVKSLALNTSDIEFGTTDNQGNYTRLNGPTYSAYPNTIKVTLRLDNQANGPLNLFFGKVLGTSATNVTATASATIYSGSIDSLQTNPAFISRMLPMTFDVNNWTNFLKTGQQPDGTVNLDANGVPQIQVYPSIKDTGNFGLLSLDQSNDGASTISGWIDNGVSASDLQNEFSENLLPLSKHNPNSWDWKGNPGLKTSDIHALAYHVGDTYLLPLFKPLDPGVPDPSTYTAGTGNASHYYYNIVAFVGIRISYVDNKSVVVQPAPAIDPNAVFGSVVPASPPTGSSPLVTTFTTCKLTQ